VRVTPATVAIHGLTAQPDGSTLLAVHSRAERRGSWVVDERHWDGLPDGTGRATTDRVSDPLPTRTPAPEPNPLGALLTRSAAAQVPVGRRSLAAYDAAAGLTTRTRHGRNGTTS
jgi:hypothetical protein